MTAVSSRVLSGYLRDPVRLVTDLMAVPGRSGAEGEIARRVAGILESAGVPPSCISTDAANKKNPIGGDCGNLIVKLPGTTRRPRRLLMAHLDTVPLCVSSKPVRRGDRIISNDRATGLGGDNRAGVAVVLHAAITLLRHRLPHPPLTLLFTVQEEIGLVGARNVGVGKLGKPALCFNWDGGDPAAITVGATGAIAMEIHVRGVASHAGVHPEQGVSAAAIAARALSELDQAGWHGLVKNEGRTGTSNVGVVTGGEATNVVMPELRVRAEARSHDPAFRERIVAEFESAFRRAAREVRNDAGAFGQIEFHADLKYESFRLDDDSPPVAEAQAAVRRASREPRLVVGNGGLDANWMTAHRLPTVTLGCGQHDIHTVTEWLDVAEFETACRIALDLATNGAAA